MSFRNAFYKTPGQRIAVGFIVLAVGSRHFVFVLVDVKFERKMKNLSKKWQFLEKLANAMNGFAFEEIEGRELLEVRLGWDSVKGGGGWWGNFVEGQGAAADFAK